MTKLGCLSAAVVGLAAITARGDDWPQFRGPNRDGVSAETALLKQWPAGGPRLAWTYADTGLGYSGPAVVGDRLYVAGGRGEKEYLIAIDVNTAKEVWAVEIGPLFQWRGNNWNTGPNATPTVGGGRVYALGGRGDLVCVGTDGKVQWRKNLPRDFGGEVNPIGGGAEDPTPLGWGYAAAPLLDGGRLVCTPGGPKGLLAALDAATGAVVWQSKGVTDQAPYSSPLAVTVGGVRQYVQVTNAGIVGVAAADGSRLWAYRRQPPFDDVVIATPVFHDNHVYATVGFRQGCDLVKLVPGGTGVTAETVYSNKAVENRDGGMVRVGGHLYGHSENAGWVCQEFKTGKVVWAEPDKLGRGSVVAAGGNLYCVAERGGAVVMAEATPAGWAEKGRFKLPKESARRRPSGGLWTHPVVANGRLYVRDQELLFCFDVRP